MEQREISFKLSVYSNPQQLPPNYAMLLQRAAGALNDSYSPYSNFKVAAAVMLANGQVLTGTNQENAAFPVGICAEGTALSAASAMFPQVAVTAIAITVKNARKPVEKPVAPCGVCRQRLLEYEMRFNQPIAIIMAGETGEVYAVDSVKQLLPLYFSGSNL